jgi:hypothetical protein
MNLEKNIGENKYKHIYVFGCSHSLNTNSIDITCKSYSDQLAQKLNVPLENVYNYAINGSSNSENLYYLNSIYSKLSFYHPGSSARYQKFKNYLPTEIYDDSLIIFQLTYWHRNTFQHTTIKQNGHHLLVPLGPHRKFENDPPFYDKDLTTFCSIYYTKLSNTNFLERNTILPIYHTLKNINNERNNVVPLLIAWDGVSDIEFFEYIPKELTNIQDFVTKEEWTCDFSLKNGDIHLSPSGYDKFSDYLLKYITH